MCKAEKPVRQVLRQGITFKDLDTHEVPDIYSIKHHNKNDPALTSDVIVAHRAV